MAFAHGTQGDRGFSPLAGRKVETRRRRPAARILSLLHVVMPVLLFSSLERLGCDRPGTAGPGGDRLGGALPASSAVVSPELNVDWRWRPVEKEQTLLSPMAYFAFAMVACPLVFYLPIHLVLTRWLDPSKTGPVTALVRRPSCARIAPLH